MEAIGLNQNNLSIAAGCGCWCGCSCRCHIYVPNFIATDSLRHGNNVRGHNNARG